MKKLVVLAMVLAMGSTAMAGFSVSVVGHPDMMIAPSDTVTLQIVSLNEPWDIGLCMLATGPSSVDITNAVVIGAHGFGVIDYTGAEGFEAYDWFLSADMYWNGMCYPMPDGVRVDGIALHCEGPGDVVIELWDFFPDIPVNYGTYVIHQVPEPMTLGLLGIGGLMLRRRR